MEQTSYRAAQRAGDCHAVDATNRLEQLVRKSKKRDPRRPRCTRRAARAGAGCARSRSAARAAGATSGGSSSPRATRCGGPARPRTPRNVRYSVLTQRAAAAGEGLFTPATAASGPNEGHADRRVGATGTPTATTARTSTASGSRSATTTPSTRCRSTAGTCATRACAASRSRRARRSPPNSSVTVYAGQGENFGGEYFWNLTAPVFDNTTRDDRSIGRRRLPVRPPGRPPRLDDLPLQDQLRRPGAGPHRARHAAAPRGVHLAPQHGTCRSTSRRYRAQDLALLLRVPAGLDARRRRDDARLHPGRPGGGHRSSTSTGA